MKTSALKVVFLIGGLGGGGSERQLYLLLRHLVKTWECHIVVFNQDPNFVFNEALEKIGVSIWPAPCRGAFRRLIFLTKLLSHLKPHVVHSWTVHDNPYAGIAGRMTGVPVRLGSLRSSVYLGTFENLPALYKKLSIDSVQALVVNAGSTRDELLAQGFPEKRVFVLQNGVGFEDIQSATPTNLASLGVPFHVKVVGTIGNLRIVKNHKIFIRALARVIQANPEVYGLIVGQSMSSEPDTEKEIRKEIQTAGLEKKIILTGHSHNVPGILKRLDAFCLLSSSEGLPNALLEAMAAGCGVVASRVGGIPELIHDGMNGFLVAPGNIEETAERIQHLLENPAQIRRFGAAAQKTIEERFRIEDKARELAAFYEKLLELKTRSL